MKVIIKEDIIADLRWYRPGDIFENVEKSHYPGYYIDIKSDKYINISDCYTLKELRKQKIESLCLNQEIE